MGLQWCYEVGPWPKPKWSMDRASSDLSHDTEPGDRGVEMDSVGRIVEPKIFGLQHRAVMSNL